MKVQYLAVNSLPCHGLLPAYADLRALVNIVVDGGDIIAIEFIQVVQRSDFDDRFLPHSILASVEIPNSTIQVGHYAGPCR